MNDWQATLKILYQALLNKTLSPEDYATLAFGLDYFLGNLILPHSTIGVDPLDMFATISQSVIESFVQISLKQLGTTPPRV